MLKPLVFTVVAVVLVAGLAEAALRIAGFRYDTRLAYFRFPFPNDEQLHSVFEPDPVVFWRLKPGYAFGGALGAVNARGYRGPVYTPRKPDGVTRMVCLGDSVTFGTDHTYPRFLESALRERAPGAAWEIINAGVPGYTSYQGVLLYKTEFARYDPDIVTIMYGWNDHWLSGGYPDNAQKLPRGTAAAIRRTLQPLRVYQGVSRIVAAARDMTNTRGDGDDTPPVRVRLPEYKHNLETLVASVRTNGARPVLLTTPSGLDAGIIPDYIARLGFIEQRPGETDADLLARVRGVHAAYNQVVRQVALDTETTLIDLDDVYAAYRAFTGEPLFDHPEKDIIHPNADGYQLIADAIADEITQPEE